MLSTFAMCIGKCLVSDVCFIYSGYEPREMLCTEGGDFVSAGSTILLVVSVGI